MPINSLSNLSEIAESPAAEDMLVIRDVSAEKTRKITVANLKKDLVSVEAFAAEVAARKKHEAMPNPHADSVSKQDLSAVVETAVATSREALISCLRDRLGMFFGVTQPSFNIFCGEASNRSVPVGVFCRSTPGMCFGQAGNLTTVESGNVRRTWNQDGTLIGWNIEETRANLLKYSDQFDDDAWVKILVENKKNVAMAPNGTLSATKIISTTVKSGAHSMYHKVNTIINEKYAFSLFAKADDYEYLGLSLYDTQYLLTTFNLKKGIIESGDGSIEDVGDGWYRCSTFFTATKSTCYARIYVFGSYPLQGYAGDDISGLYIWGAQVENGTFASSYIPTTNVPVVRSADVWTVAIDDLWFNIPFGTMFVVACTAPGAPASGSIQVLAQYDDDTARNRICIIRDEERVLRCLVTTEGREACNLPLGIVPDLTMLRVAFSWSESGFSASRDGGVSAMVSASSVPVKLTTHRIGSGAFTASQWGGHILQDVFFPVAMSDVDKKAITR